MQSPRVEALARMQQLWQLPRTQYLVAAAGVAAVTLLRMAFEPWLHGQAPFALFFPVVAAIAWTFGVGPTLFAIALSGALAWWLIIPDSAWARTISLSLYLLSSGGLVILARIAAATRRNVVQALEESERAQVERARLAAIVSSSDDAIIAKDLNGIILSWNSGAERVFGYSSEEIVGHSITQLIPDARRFEEDHILLRLRRGERIEHFETVRVAKDGRELDISLSVSPIRNAAGEVVGASKIARDVTERRRAERAIAEQRELFRATLSSIGDAVVTTDAAGCITYMNPVAAAWSGYSQNEAQGAPLGSIFRLMHEGTRQPIEDAYSQLVRSATGLRKEQSTLLITRDEREIPVEDRATLILDATGQPRGMVVCLRDVRAQRDAEAARRQTEAQRQSAERERELLLQSERAARAEAERANRLKDQFLATVSHELRTPLNAILGWADLLRRNADDKQALARGLPVIERNARIQTQLVSDLLDVSRIVSGKLKLELSLVSLHAVVDQALDTVRAAADAKQLRVERWIDPELSAMVGDADRLQQVVWNLLSNAVKFTPQGGTVSVRVERIEQQAQITVSDTGAGVPPEFLPHLFDRFRQADASSTRRYGGLGLGLTIVKQLVELHGGSITAESPGPNRGATFRVQLPVDVPGWAGHEAETERPSVATHAGAAAMQQRLRGLRVLVVEDDADSRELLERLLGEAGCKVSAASCAREAVEQLSEHICDLLISDIGLPDQDGYALLIELRQRAEPRIAHMPAVALTAFARSEDRARALRAGFQAHLAKPIDPAELLATVTSFAGLVSTQRSA